MTNKYYHMSILKSTFTKYFDNIADPPTPLTRLTYPVKLKAEPARSTTSFGGISGNPSNEVIRRAFVPPRSPPLAQITSTLKKMSFLRRPEKTSI